MLIAGSRLIVSDNSGAKEVQCIKTKGKYASLGDIITCSIKRSGKGKVTQVCFRGSVATKALHAKSRVGSIHTYFFPSKLVFS